MASKIKVTSQNEETVEKEVPETPLLDLSDAALIRKSVFPYAYKFCACGIALCGATRMPEAT